MRLPDRGSKRDVADDVLQIAHNPHAQPVLLVADLELFRDQDLRSATAPLEQIGHRLHGRVPVEPALHQHIGHRTLMVCRVPQLALLSVDRDDYPIDSPLVASRQGSGPNTSSDIQPELHRQRRTASYDRSMPQATSSSSTVRLGFCCRTSAKTIRFRLPTFF